MGSAEQATHLGSGLHQLIQHQQHLQQQQQQQQQKSKSSERIRLRIDMEEVQVNGSFRSVIKVNGGDAEESNFLFPTHLLDNLHEDDANKVPALPPLGSGLLLRPLLLSDFNTGFLSLLTQLTSVGEVTWQQWEERWSQLKAASGYFIIVVEDVAEEEVVVSDEYRGRQLGKLLVSSCSLLAKRLNCYKVTLNCNDKMVKFYTSLGYSCEQGNANYMCIRLDK